MGVEVRPLTVDAAGLAKMLSVSRRTVYTWDGSGIIPAPVRVGGRVLWSVREVEAWLLHGSPDRAAWERVRVERMR